MRSKRGRVQGAAAGVVVPFGPRPVTAEDPREPAARRGPAIVEARMRLAEVPSTDGTIVREDRLLLFAGALPPRRSIALELVRNEAGDAFRLEIALRSTAGEEADALAGALASLTRWAAPSATFRVASRDGGVARRRVELEPDPAPRGAADCRTDPDAGVVLAACASAAADLGCALDACGRAGVMRLAFEIAPRRLEADERTMLEAMKWRLGAERGRSSAAWAHHRVLECWLEADGGVSFRVALESEDEVAADAQDAIALALFGCARARAPGRGVDLRLCFPSRTSPPWRFTPAPGELRMRGDDVAEESGPTPGSVALGVDSAGDPVRISAIDRMRHVYMIGGSGTGKTTGMLNMILEDAEGGEGLIVFDPHGDLAEAARSRLPAGRRSDLLWIDPSDRKRATRLDLFATPGVDPDLERNYVVNQLLVLFRRLYASVPEAFGPMFEQYFRNAFFLIFLAKDPADRSLLRFEEVFIDKDFRHRLVAECPDRKVKQFWREIAERTRGDQSLENMAPYITCKLAQLTGNPLTRRFIGPGRSKLIDLRRAMDEGHIVIARLSKGALGEYDARFMGALMLMKLTEAAMARAGEPEASRRPFRVYIDEFQTLATRATADMLAESRKFGLSFTLANQNLAQLHAGAEADVAQAALANCGTWAAFRLGLPDAVLLSAHLEASVSALTSLGLGEMIVRRLRNGAPQRAQRLRGLPPLAAAGVARTAPAAAADSPARPPGDSPRPTGGAARRGSRAPGGAPSRRER